MKTYRHQQYRYWYDPSVRSWTVVEIDSEGNQVGDADYCCNRESLLAVYPDFTFIPEP